MLGKRVDDLIQEVISSIDERCSKFGIYRGDYQFLVISDLFGNYLVDLNSFLFAKLFGGALGVP